MRVTEIYCDILMPLTRHNIFGMCNFSWKKCNISLKNKTIILINFFTVKVSSFDVILQISFLLLFYSENSPDDIISGNIDTEKVDQEETFDL